MAQGVVKCSVCVPRLRKLFSMLFKQNDIGYPLTGVLHIEPSVLRFPGGYDYVTTPFFMIKHETVVGISYSGRKVWNPYSSKEQWYWVHFAKLYKDRILTSGGIKPVNNSLVRLLPGIREALALFSSSLAYLHDGSQLCYLNSTYVPLNENSGYHVGVMIGRLSSLRTITNPRVYDELGMFSFRNNLLLLKADKMRFPICSATDTGIMCRKASVDNIYVTFPKNLADMIANGVTGVFVTITYPSNWTSGRRFNILVTAMLDYLERCNKHNCAEPTLFELSLASYALLLAAVQHADTSISRKHFENIYKALANVIQSYIGVHYQRIDLSDGTRLENLIQVLESKGLLLIYKDRRNGEELLSWLTGERFLNVRKQYAMLTPALAKKALHPRESIRRTTSRNNILEGLHRGCYLVI